MLASAIHGDHDSGLHTSYVRVLSESAMYSQCLHGAVPTDRRVSAVPRLSVSASAIVPLPDPQVDEAGHGLDQIR